MHSVCKTDEVIAIELTMDFTNLAWSQYKRFVSKSRQETIDRFLYVEDKMRCLYAALLVRKKCMELTGISIEEQNFVILEGGKPRLSDSNLSFNISHSGKRIFACFALREIGVDVEKVGNAPFYVMKSVFHEEEIAYVESAGNPITRNERFFEVWTCKESFGKWKGDGIVYDMKLYNTKAQTMSNYYKTWFRDGYCYSVYMDEVYHLTLIQETNENIEQFFQNSIDVSLASGFH